MLYRNRLGMVFWSLASSIIWAALKILLLYKIVSLCIYNQVHTTLACSLNLTLATKLVSNIKHDRPPSPRTKAVSFLFTSLAFASGPISWTHCSFPTCQLSSLSAAAMTESILSASFSSPFRFQAKFNNGFKWKLDYWLQWSCSCLEQGWVWPALPIASHKIPN